MVRVLPRRSDVPTEQTWDIASIYVSNDAWAEAYAAASAAVPELMQFRGRLGETVATLRDGLQMRDHHRAEVGRIREYANMQSKSDVGDQDAATRFQQANDLSSRLTEALAFFEPELLALDPHRLQTMMVELPELAIYTHYFAVLQQRRAHAQPAAVERVLAAASNLAANPYRTYRTLVNAELPFDTVVDGDGATVRLAQGNVRPLTYHRDRAVRKVAWEAYADAHLALHNTLANTLIGTFTRNIFFARARDYPTALDAALDASHLPMAVYTTLIATCRKYLPLWHRYWEIKRRALGVETLHGYDIDVPIVRTERVIPYDEGRAIVCAALAPLGDEYAALLRRGLYDERWVDWCANEGKVAGAESSGVYGTRPFLLLPYDNSLISVSALSHELGHSVHSAFTWQTQPYVYAYMEDSITEAAANVNQALVRAHLLTTADDPDFQLEVLGEAMAYFHRYLFLMPALSQFELTCHARLERGEGLTADGMSACLLDLFRAGYGPSISLDAARTGIAWAQYPHLFLDFYTYKYALGIAAACALADGVLHDGPDAAARY
ncbi:MAG: oligoendopeptidase F family protein, partial [Chloroflexota bacterium]|nr:oligoendopeptidase F family protein [Chloroflexota bacterium]